MSQRKKYSAEFKREAVELTRRSGVSCRQVALDIGINPNMLSRWVREAEAGSAKAFSGSGNPRDEEIARVEPWTPPDPMFLITSSDSTTLGCGVESHSRIRNS